MLQNIYFTELSNLQSALKKPGIRTLIPTIEGVNQVQIHSQKCLKAKVKLVQISEVNQDLCSI